VVHESQEENRNIKGTLSFSFQPRPEGPSCDGDFLRRRVNPSRPERVINLRHPTNLVSFCIHERKDRGPRASHRFRRIAPSARSPVAAGLRGGLGVRFPGIIRREAGPAGFRPMARKQHRRAARDCKRPAEGPTRPSAHPAEHQKPQTADWCGQTRDFKTRRSK